MVFLAFHAMVPFLREYSAGGQLNVRVLRCTEQYVPCTCHGSTAGRGALVCGVPSPAPRVSVQDPPPCSPLPAASCCHLGHPPLPAKPQAKLQVLGPPQHIIQRHVGCHWHDNASNPMAVVRICDHGGNCICTRCSHFWTTVWDGKCCTVH